MPEPIDAAFREQMNTLARSLDKAFNGDKRGKDRDTGFVLLAFPFDAVEGARTNYISNADRRDIIVSLKEIVARFEGQPEIKGKDYSIWCEQQRQFARLAAAPLSGGGKVEVTNGVVDAQWQWLCDKDDRSSPVEYPDMALVTRDELGEIIVAVLSTMGGKRP